MMRKFTHIDNLIAKTNETLNILFNIKSSGREYPAKNIVQNELINSDKDHVINLMRVNHSGEVAAQGLYIGHALLAKTNEQKTMMLNMASEEKDHLEWCDQRIKELKGNTSIFNPIWFTGSVAIGMLSSMSKDKNALGFIEETEKQVAEHLELHINKIPEEDNKTYSILMKMKSDEIQHGETAHISGATELPKNLKNIMKFTASIMKFVSFRM
jgi:ubiquinone biosynthesis monooxygenase Coq7